LKSNTADLHSMPFNKARQKQLSLDGMLNIENFTDVLGRDYLYGAYELTMRISLD